MIFPLAVGSGAFQRAFHSAGAVSRAVAQPGWLRAARASARKAPVAGAAAVGEMSAGVWVVCSPGGAARRDRRGPRPPGLGGVSARRGHRRCLYPGAREHDRPVGRVGSWGLGKSFESGPLFFAFSSAVGGVALRGRRAVCSPGGAIDVVYTPGAREHAGRGNGAVLGAGSRVGVVGRVLSSLRVVRGVRLGPVGRVSSLSLPVRWAGLLGPRGGAGQTGRIRGAGLGRSGPRRACGVVGCGVSGRLVRRRCRSGRCAGGRRGRGWTARWW